MWIVALALRRPVTIVVMAALMMLLGLVAFFAMPKDIFPAVNIPEINLVWYYPGMSAPEVEKRIINITERATSQTVNGIDHIESTSFNGIGVVKIYMQEGANTALGISQLNSVTSAIRNILPPGIAPPTVLDFDATNVPIADIVASSESLSDAQLYDYMFNFVGLFLFTLPGIQSPAPFGGATRQIMLNLNPDRLYSRGLSPQDVLSTLQSSNVIYPGGTVKLGNYETGPKGRASSEELAINVPARLHYVPIDFERQTLTNGLCAGGVNLSAATFFSWLGVTPYLSPAAVLTLY